jgi:hypothetical protein
MLSVVLRKADVLGGQVGSNGMDIFEAGEVIDDAENPDVER